MNIEYKMTSVSTSVEFVNVVSDVCQECKVLDIQAVLKESRPSMQKTFAAQHYQTCKMLDQILESYGKEFVVADGETIMRLLITKETEAVTCCHESIFNSSAYTFKFHERKRMILEMSYCGVFESDPLPDVDPDGFRTNVQIHIMESTMMKSRLQLLHFVMRFAEVFQMPFVMDDTERSEKDMLDEVFRYLEQRPSTTTEAGFDNTARIANYRTHMLECRVHEIARLVAMIYDEQAGKFEDRLETVPSKYSDRVIAHHRYSRNRLFQDTVSSEILQHKITDEYSFTLATAVSVLHDLFQEDSVIRDDKDLRMVDYLCSLYKQEQYLLLTRFVTYFKLFQTVDPEEAHRFYAVYPHIRDYGCLPYTSGLMFCGMFHGLMEHFRYSAVHYTRPEFRRDIPETLQKPQRHDYDFVSECRETKDQDLTSTESNMADRDDAVHDSNKSELVEATA